MPRRIPISTATANKLKHIVEIHVRPYHPLGESKSERLGKKYALAGKPFPEKEIVEKWIKKIRERTSVSVKRA